MLLTLLDGLGQSNFKEGMSGLNVLEASARYGYEEMSLMLTLLAATGVSRVSHINDQPQEEWGVLLDKPRRPDGDTVDQCLNQIIALDEEENEATVAERLGQIRPGGMIDMTQQASLRGWVEARLTDGDIWYFDDHVIEYTGQTRIGKTKHGTKHFSVKAVNRYTLHNGLCSLSEYFPLTVSYSEAMRHLVSKANACLPQEERIRKLSFDRAGWDSGLLQWLPKEESVIPITWVKRTEGNIALMAAVDDEEFVLVDVEMLVGKSQKQHIVRVADTRLEFPHLGSQRVIVLETNSAKRIGIYTTSPLPGAVPLADQRAMSAASLMDAMRYKQRIENRFKVEVNEMNSDALPSHRTLHATRIEPYELEAATKQLDNAQKRLGKYDAQSQSEQQLHEAGELDKHQLNILQKRTQKLHDKAERLIETRSLEIAQVEFDHDGHPFIATDIDVMDVRKLTLLNLFKLHALVALKILASRLGIPGAGPERLRRSFLAFGDRVEFDHDQLIATVYARSFPRATVRQAYERLCAELHDVPLTLTRNGLTYRLRFSW